jgi:hypothetical protein
MPEIDPLARLLGVLENKLDSGLARLAEHAAEDARRFTLLHFEIREAVELLAREQAEAIRRVEESLDRLVEVPGEIAAMREVLHGSEGGPGLVEGMRKITSIIDGDRGRRAAYALVGAMLIGLVGIGSGIANLWHLLFSHR